jgi:hypothetical protein
MNRRQRGWLPDVATKLVVKVVMGLLAAVVIFNDEIGHRQLTAIVLVCLP